MLRGHAYTLAHVGDSRAWLMRDGECLQLTQDHAFDHPDQRSRLTRAIGLDDRVRVDYLQGDLQLGDAFVLTSDGVHGVLSRANIAAAVACRSAAAQARAPRRWCARRWPPAAATTPARWWSASAASPTARLEDAAAWPAAARAAAAEAPATASTAM